MTIVAKRSFFDVMIGEPLELAKSQPHQILLSTGSVALMGQFAATDGIVSAPVGYLIAIGVEWAYLRGLASDSRAQTRWGGILNWSAFGIVVLWGVLWCAGLFHAFDPTNGGWWLAAAHVVPVAWLSLCSAQCHRAAMAEERRQAARDADRERAKAEARESEDREIERQRQLMNLEMERKWKELKLAQDAREMRAHTSDARMLPSLMPKTHRAACCGASLTQPEAAAMNRWKTCKACGSKEARAEKVS